MIEVQTRGFSSIRRKVSTLLELGHRLLIVHPVAVDRRIVKVDPDGTIVGRRRSPRHGTVIDVFAELVSFPALMTHPRLELDVLLTVEEEYRTQSPGRNWRRNGWSVVERRLVEVVGSVFLRNAEDLMGLIPDGLPETFTTADLAESLGRPRRAAQQMAYCLRHAGVIEEVGKRGTSVEFRVG